MKVSKLKISAIAVIALLGVSTPDRSVYASSVSAQVDMYEDVRREVERAQNLRWALLRYYHDNFRWPANWGELINHYPTGQPQTIFGDLYNFVVVGDNVEVTFDLQENRFSEYASRRLEQSLLNGTVVRMIVAPPASMIAYREMLGRNPSAAFPDNNLMGQNLRMGGFDITDVGNIIGATGTLDELTVNGTVNSSSLITNSATVNNNLVVGNQVIAPSIDIASGEVDTLVTVDLDSTSFETVNAEVTGVFTVNEMVSSGLSTFNAPIQVNDTLSADELVSRSSVRGVNGYFTGTVSSVTVDSDVGSIDDLTFSVGRGGTLNLTNLSASVGTIPIINSDVVNTDTVNTDIVNTISVNTQTQEIRRTSGAPVLDFSNDSSSDYDVRFRLKNNDTIEVVGGVLEGDLTGNATTASALARPVNLSIRDGSGSNIEVHSFNGSSNVTFDISDARVGYATNANYANSAGNANTLDGIDSTGFVLRNGSWSGGSGSSYSTVHYSTKGVGNGKYTVYSDSGKMDFVIDGEYYANEGRYRVFHTGNDGSGSGLDADTIDGYDSSSLVFTTNSNVFTRPQTFKSAGRALIVGGDSAFDSTDTSIYIGNSPTQYGFDIKYLGSLGGNENALAIISTNAGSPREALRIKQDGSVTFGQAVYMKNSVFINDTNTRISEGSGNSVRFTTNSGYIDFGAQNSSYAHITTDRPDFYFNKDVHVAGEVRAYNSNTYFNSGGYYTNGRYYSYNNQGGLVGNYSASPTSSQMIWTIGSSWTTLGRHYGLGYEYGKQIDGASNQHQIVVRQNGTTNIRLGMDGSARFAKSIYSGGTVDANAFTTNDVTIYNNAESGVVIQNSSSGSNKYGRLEVRGNGAPGYIDLANDAAVNYDARFWLNSDNSLSLLGVTNFIMDSFEVANSNPAFTFTTKYAGNRRSQSIIFDGASNSIQIDRLRTKDYTSLIQNWGDLNQAGDSYFRWGSSSNKSTMTIDVAASLLKFNITEEMPRSSNDYITLKQILEQGAGAGSGHATSAGWADIGGGFVLVWTQFSTNTDNNQTVTLPITTTGGCTAWFQGVDVDYNVNSAASCSGNKATVNRFNSINVTRTVKMYLITKKA